MSVFNHQFLKPVYYHTTFLPEVNPMCWLCGCSTILSPCNCSEKMSSYEGAGGIEQEGTSKANGAE
jgi:hypothetical protein